MKTFKLFTRTALVVLALGPLTAFSQTPAPNAVTNAEKSSKPGETSTLPNARSSTAQGSSGNTGAGGVTNAEKSAKPGETSAPPRNSSSPGQGPSMGDTSGTGAVSTGERRARADRN